LQHAKVNVNMASAFTHVGADTLRTSSVFVAAAIAALTNVPGEICDAWASIVVTITIRK
jgi:Co/Zn/Cd efflux system component